MPSTKDSETYIDVLRYHLELLINERDELDKQINEFNTKIQTERKILNLIKE